MATLAELQALRAEVYTSYRNALTGKGYTIGSAGGSSRSHQRQDLIVLRQELDRLDNDIAIKQGTQSKIRYVRPIDR